MWSQPSSLSTRYPHSGHGLVVASISFSDALFSSSLSSLKSSLCLAQVSSSCIGSSHTTHHLHSHTWQVKMLPSFRVEKKQPQSHEPDGHAWNSLSLFQQAFAALSSQLFSVSNATFPKLWILHHTLVVDLRVCKTFDVCFLECRIALRTLNIRTFLLVVDV